MGKATWTETQARVIKQMSDAEALEAQLVENPIRAEIHPMEETKVSMSNGNSFLLGQLRARPPCSRVSLHQCPQLCR